MYVKEFLPDAYGSTVVVPDEWVTQTGSDFDVDSCIIFLTFKQKTTALSFDLKNKKSEPYYGSLFFYF